MALRSFGCPAHDQRDFDCKKYDLEIKLVRPVDEKNDYQVTTEAYAGPGVLINHTLDGLQAPNN